jgi:hypothetical protein
MRAAGANPQRDRDHASGAASSRSTDRAHVSCGSSAGPLSIPDSTALAAARRCCTRRGAARR